ncbi:hypothetical protein SLH46_07700 [Draconibacterium sp. IB214405]|uniref:hypothetical protein n=1 Tax=Draconibacterium sp. IB214405 TaxID=3097352 RepID=UPI002A0D6048|nr:hypothetical protein [Draconibacterium sp. IB214405]MDX8339063.1 hypothetical protein [Draconibacterium sp. IB214405]
MSDFTKQGPVKARFKAPTKDLRRVFRILNNAFDAKRKNQYPYCEITIKTKKVEFVVAGIKECIECEAKGPARINISYKYFKHLVNDRPLKITKVEVGNEYMIVNDITTMVETCFFKNDKILRSINLPVNYDVTDILRLADRYTVEEITFNKLKAELSWAQDKLEKDIKKINKILKPYKISPDKVEEFIMQSINPEVTVDAEI